MAYVEILCGNFKTGKKGATFNETRDPLPTFVMANRKKRKISLASNVSSTANVKGAVSRVLLKSGLPVSTQLYFRLPKVSLSSIERKRLESELTIIRNADGPLGGVALPILESVQAFTFCSIRHTPVIDRFGNSQSRRTVLRAPRCGDHFFTAIQTDVLDSYALVHSILDFCDRTYCFVRWVTPTFPGSRNPPGATQICAQHFRRFKITDTYAVINILQVQAVVCFVPVFSAPGFLWLNDRPLGTALRSYSQEEDISPSPTTLD